MAEILAGRDLKHNEILRKPYGSLKNNLELNNLFKCELYLLQKTKMKMKK